MIFLGLVVAQSELALDDRWAYERTLRYLNEAEAIDYSDVERLEFKALAVAGDGYRLELSRNMVATIFGADRVPPTQDSKPLVTTLTFGPTGQPKSVPDDGLHAIRSRVDRAMWSLLETRKGLSWSRQWPAAGDTPAGKATVRPTAEGTLQVTYTETGGLTLEGTAKRDPKRPILNELRATINRTFLPKGELPVSVAIRQVRIP